MRDGEYPVNEFSIHSPPGRKIPAVPPGIPLVPGPGEDGQWVAHNRTASKSRLKENFVRVLLVSTDEGGPHILSIALSRWYGEPTVERVDGAAALAEALKHGPWQAVISESTLSGFNGLAALDVVKNSGEDIPFFILTNNPAEEAQALDAMADGVRDYFPKDQLERLGAAVVRESQGVENRFRLKKVEDEFRQAQKMEALGRLASGVSHDFNNLLTAMAGYAELCQKSVGDNHPARSDLQEILNCVRRAGDLTRQLLAFTRRQASNVQAVNINTLLTEMNKMLKRLIGEDIFLMCNLDPNIGLVKIDPGYVEQIVMNLAVNARDAMPQGGTLVVETSNVLLDETHRAEYREVQPGPYVMLCVRDTGVGMDAKTRSRIFEPYFTTKEVGKGTGLGLATVFDIVKQSGGHIFVDSRPGRGTAFRIYVPRCDETTEPPEKPAAEPETLSRKSATVLLVEDADDVREMARRFLTKNGYEVLVANSAEEAILIGQTHTGNVDLIVTDVIMPQMNGPDLVKRLAPLLPKMKVLFISGYAHPDILTSETTRGGKGLLLKPFRPEDLVRKINDVLKEEV